MFGFTGADPAETVVRKRRYMAESPARWPFLTHFDASTIKNDRQLVTMVRDRCSLLQPDTESDVRE